MKPLVPQPSCQSLCALDWLNFFLADVRTGVGPFVAIYLASQHWNQEAVGIALTVGGLAGVLSQAPGGAVVDRVRSKRLLIGLAILTIALGALILAVQPSGPFVVAAQLLTGVVSGVLGPSIAAVTLGLVGHSQMAERVGRNHRFDSAGNVVAAAVMGLVGYVVGNRAIFYLAAGLALPTLLTLSRVRGNEIDYVRARGEVDHDRSRAEGFAEILRNHRLLTFAVCAVLFHFANAAMLPLLGQMLAEGKARQSSLLMSACIMVTQCVVALASPWVGRLAQTWGRKPLLLIGFGVLPLRGLLYTLTVSPSLQISIQVLDGIGAAVFGVVSVLVIADVTYGTGRFNFAQGAVGTAVGIGASLSNAVAGTIAHRFGYAASFLSLAGVAVCATAILWLAMPETKPITAAENMSPWIKDDSDPDPRVPAIKIAAVQTMENTR